jgi:COP9 signalosome complex subunit 4
MEQQVQEAISSDNYSGLNQIFTSSWQSLGQGEQRSLSAFFIKAALSSSTFLPNAFSSQNDLALNVMKITLSHLPPSLPNAQDNIFRLKIFDHLVDAVQDFHSAANILAGYRMEDDNEGSPYYAPPAQKTDIYVKIAECFLAEDDIVEAETFVTRAGAAVEILNFQNSNANADANADADDNAADDEDKDGDADDASNEKSSNEHIALILRYKSVYARVLDANRKFLQAASRYYDLAALGSQTDIIDTDEIVEFLGKAATCAILAPSSAQRQRVLGLVYNDERLLQLDSISHFSTHSSILSKMYKEQVIRRGDDLKKFEDSLADHQRALMSDGLTIVERALIEHNMVAVSQIYSNIYFTALGQLLGLSSARAEKIASKMILDGSLKASIDQLDGVLTFSDQESALVSWDGAITSFCVQLNSVTDAVRQIS